MEVRNSGEAFAGSYDGLESGTILRGGLFKNIKVSNPDLSGYVIGFHCGGPACQDVRIQKAEIDLTGSSGGGSGADGIAMERGNNILVEDSIVQGASADGIDFKASQVAVVNTQVKHIGRNGIKFWQGGDIINSLSTDTGADAALVFDGPGKYRLINSVIAYHNKNGQNSYTATFGYDSGGKQMEIEIINSIFHNNVGSVWVHPQAKFQIKNTIFSGGTKTGRYVDYQNKEYGDMANNKITALDKSLLEIKAVGFVNAAKDDFHLKSSSLAVDAGIKTNVVFDLDNNLRPSGKGFDIGPYELTVGGKSKVDIQPIKKTAPPVKEKTVVKKPKSNKKDKSEENSCPSFKKEIKLVIKLLQKILAQMG